MLFISQSLHLNCNDGHSFVFSRKNETKKTRKNEKNEKNENNEKKIKKNGKKNEKIEKMNEKNSKNQENQTNHCAEQKNQTCHMECELSFVNNVIHR